MKVPWVLRVVVLAAVRTPAVCKISKQTLVFPYLNAPKVAPQYDTRFE